jgi:hypothetical protein
MHANSDQQITKGAQPTRENKSIIKKVKSGTYRLEALYVDAVSRLEAAN